MRAEQLEVTLIGQTQQIADLVIQSVVDRILFVLDVDRYFPVSRCGPCRLPMWNAVLLMFSFSEPSAGLTFCKDSV